jgi:Tol biopolymer transport system component/DNA-binding winged helix-turn-helix (wHTH) protein
METAARSEHLVSFKSFEFDPHTRELHRNGRIIKLHGHPIDVLAILLERPGELVTREELKKRLWPKDTFVDFEQILNNSISMLRDALHDRVEGPQYIETLPRLGYRFIAPVRVATGNATTTKFAAEETWTAEPTVELTRPTEHSIPASGSSRWMLWATATVFVAVLTTGGWYYTHLPLAPPRLTDPVRLTVDGRRKTVVGTDGNRLYLNIIEPAAVGQVPVSGGQITDLPIDLPTRGGLWGISSISPDGSKLLFFDHFDFHEGATIFEVGALGHPVRYLMRSFPPVWSPDGKSVLYASPHGDIYSSAIEGGEPRLILASPAPKGETARTSDLTWSPDASTIRFTRDDKIWEVSSNGSNPHQLLPGWRESVLQWGGQWTPDGEFFLFVSGNTGSLLSRNPNFRRGGQLWAIDERRGRLRPPISAPIQLTSGPIFWGPAVFARNGHTVFSRGMSLRGELVRYDERSAHFDPYLHGISAEMVAFSRDRKFVAYVSFPDGILWRANRDGTGILQLTKPPFYPRDVRWSPDGSQITFTDNSHNGVDAIYVVSSQGGGSPERLIPEESGPQTDLTWSPDSKKVVYSTCPMASFGTWDWSKVEVRILNLATRRTMILPPRVGGFWSPRWSPDGRYIAGLPLKTDNLSIFDLKTQQWRDLLHKGQNGFPSWSKDGQSIYFLQYADNIGVFRISLSGGEERRIVDLKDSRYTGWYSHWLGLDPDDAPMLLHDAGTDEIYALTLEK